ncbi:unannotated protein [freshwater metagenome]|uniref:Unannotated protein n=1 Tax=freshwater metagenome TaxID=449393 RepID=A0A6J7LJ56_9ZZZZ
MTLAVNPSDSMSFIASNSLSPMGADVAIVGTSTGPLPVSPGIGTGIGSTGVGVSPGTGATSAFSRYESSSAIAVHVPPFASEYS